MLSGEAQVEQRNGSPVVNLGAEGAPGAKGKYVELAREQTDHIFVILAEFGNERHPDYPDQDTDPDTPGPARFDGPLHNEIDQPDRTRRQLARSGSPTTTSQYYQDLYFSDEKESLKTYYQYQSSGRYSVDGTVTDWVKVPLQRGPVRPQRRLPVRRRRVRQHLGARPGRGQPLGRGPGGAGQDPAADQRRCWPSSTSGTATTTTSTATSTSPTATSTTSRSSTPAATRPTVTRTRARTPSGATAGTPTCPTPA